MEFDMKQAADAVMGKMDGVLAAQATWFKAIDDLKGLIAEWPDIDDMIPRYKELTEEEKTYFNNVMQARQSIDNGIIYTLRQALVRYGNLLFL